MPEPLKMLRSRTAGVVLQTGFWCFGAGVLLQNWTLLERNHALRSEIDRLQHGSLVPGSSLSALTAANMEDVRTSVAGPNDGKKLLLITFSPYCPFCEKSYKKWLEASETLVADGRWKVVWVSRDSVKATREYCEKRNIPLSQVLADPSHRTYMQLGADLVPSMALVASGKVLRVWPGVIDDAAWREFYGFVRSIK